MKSAFQRSKFGDISTKSPALCNTCIAKELCIGTWSRPISSSIVMEILKSATWAWVVNSALKHSKRSAGSERHCIWVQKSCRARDMTGSRTCGAWAVLLTSFVLLEAPSDPQTRRIWIYMNYFKESVRETFPHHLKGIVKNCGVWYMGCLRLIRIRGLISIRYANCVRLTKNTWPTNHKSTPI